jgi:hypothetical protein
MWAVEINIICWEAVDDPTKLKDVWGPRQVEKTYPAVGKDIHTKEPQPVTAGD